MKTITLQGQEIFLAPNLPYQDFLQLQSELTEVVQSKRDKKYLIICNHPWLLTMGRGDRQNQNSGFTTPTFLPEHLPQFHIKRGGGLTFHGPNQIIFYPIRALSSQFGLNEYLPWLAGLAQSLAQELAKVELEYKRNPLGLWHLNHKVASIGVGLERLVTNHGLALNISPIEQEWINLVALNPCGLQGQVYRSLVEVSKINLSPDQCFEFFATKRNWL